ncbi:rRNA biogenesis protein RRP36 [Pseudocercospora fuligena]|uniref:rRNA biogenesis protein RRP36 n=1 Tax=Pseudocercospora fuligena TaxID=685502 RepID=A0A8H6RB44_9PEZI|nr:rRNA biogenesis protein RRP36 [Pseudocercospora fuligena]
MDSTGGDDVEMDGVEDESQSDAEESASDASEIQADSKQTLSDVVQNSGLSFDALQTAFKDAANAQSRKRKRGSDTLPDQEDKLQALRERLRQIKDQKAVSSASRKAPTSGVKATQDEDSDASDSDSDSAPSEEGAPSRTSKHAPAAQSSKFQVSRKRQVVDVPKRVVRDPRFDALHQKSAHSGNSEKAYSFLNDYQKDEIKELKEAAKRTKNEEDKEKLKRKVGRKRSENEWSKARIRTT